MLSLDAQLEALLFWKAEPIKIKRLGQILGQNETAVRKAIVSLQKRMEGGGVNLMIKDDEVALGTSPAASSLIKKLTEDELSRELGQSALETLTVALYKGPVTKAEIDYIRGVNSSFILRHLMIRGLVERISNPRDARSFLYRPTFTLLNHLGITKIEELPEYGTLTEKITQFLNQHDS